MMPPLGRNTALLLDIDGTLLDIAPSPGRVIVPRDLVCALQELADDLSGALAFVSGRSLAGIDRLFAPFRPVAIGAHGGEVRDITGKVTRVRALSDPVRAVFIGLAKSAPGLLLEDKGVSLALHYRLSPDAGAGLKAAMDSHAVLFDAENVHIQFGKAVIDARPRGVDKGTAVAMLARQRPFRGRAILYGGDDTTDMDVFRVLPSLHGRGFSVGRRFPGAVHVFPSPRAVRAWLIGQARMGGAP